MLRDKLRRMLRNDGGDLKIILVSLLLAFSIWLVYNLTLNYTKVVSVPIVARSNISGYRQALRHYLLSTICGTGLARS